jgi:hypothetical protein
MGKKNGDGEVQGVSEEFIDRAAVLSPAQVRSYVEPKLHGDPVKTARTGQTEYNNGSILVKSKHPLDQCLRRGIIEQQHHDSGKRIQNYRDCALSKLSGRTYNAPGEGDPEMDAGTIYANVMRGMSSTSGGRNHWKLISIICFSDPDINGGYFNEREYGALYQLAPNIQKAFEAADEAFSIARQGLERKIAESKRHAETGED